MSVRSSTIPRWARCPTSSCWRCCADCRLQRCQRRLLARPSWRRGQSIRRGAGSRWRGTNSRPSPPRRCLAWRGRSSAWLGRVSCSCVHLLCCVFAPPCVEVAGAPGFEPGSKVSQTNMLSTTPCPNGWELAEAPGFEPGSGDPKPLMLSATPCLLAVPGAEQRFALRVSNAASLVPSIVNQRRCRKGRLVSFRDVLLFIHHGRPSSV